jgi:hypothetical protein
MSSNLELGKNVRRTLFRRGRLFRLSFGCVFGGRVRNLSVSKPTYCSTSSSRNSTKQSPPSIVRRIRSSVFVRCVSSVMCFFTRRVRSLASERSVIAVMIFNLTRLTSTISRSVRDGAVNQFRESEEPIVTVRNLSLGSVMCRQEDLGRFMTRLSRDWQVLRMVGRSSGYRGVKNESSRRSVQHFEDFLNLMGPGLSQVVERNEGALNRSSSTDLALGRSE